MASFVWYKRNHTAARLEEAWSIVSTRIRPAQGLCGTASSSAGGKYAAKPSPRVSCKAWSTARSRSEALRLSVLAPLP
eukprot:5963740-Alexandrium_andersonii.AAC.1